MSISPPQLADQKPAPVLYLASASARRRLLLQEHGVAHVAAAPGVDDGELKPGRVSPEQWVAALAYLKARAGLERLMRGSNRRARSVSEGFPEHGGTPTVEDDGRWHGVVLGADTVVVKDGEIIGQPRDKEHAGWIVRRLESGSHDVVSGVALLGPGDGERLLLVDRSRVTVGAIGDARIESYLASEDWRGKAGAYNFSERIADGWPIACEGDETTVMGLPMRRLTPILTSLGVASSARGASEATPC
ncbi:MAG: hypothetical protein EA376_11720 [Phycisphaeraceae bacterium]|nr:MAG: hypothetical protein EA376_11720 [Phycisphaeraceae bacterium]